MSEIIEKIRPYEKEHIVRLIERALQMGIEVDIVSLKDTIYRLRHKELNKYIINSILPFCACNDKLVTNKQITKDILDEAGLKIAKGLLLDKYDQIKNALDKGEIEFPLVVKPVNTTRGVGVTANIKDEESLKEAVGEVEKVWKNWDKENKIIKKILVEEFFAGKDYRFLVLDGKVLGVVEREPAQIEGDGKSSVQKLIDDHNKGVKHGRPRRKINLLEIDAEVKKRLAERNFDLDSVLPQGETVKLRDKASVSMGGLCINVTEKVHEKFNNIAEQAVDECGLRWAGVDILAKDITDGESGYIVVEINGSPQYAMHEECDVGKCKDIATIILEKIFEK